MKIMKLFRLIAVLLCLFPLLYFIGFLCLLEFEDVYVKSIIDNPIVDNAYDLWESVELDDGLSFMIPEEWDLIVAGEDWYLVDSANEMIGYCCLTDDISTIPRYDYLIQQFWGLNPDATSEITETYIPYIVRIDDSNAEQITSSDFGTFYYISLASRELNQKLEIIIIADKFRTVESFVEISQAIIYSFHFYPCSE